MLRALIVLERQAPPIVKSLRSHTGLGPVLSMAEAFNQAVSALLQHADPASRAQANNWLEAWQQTSEAWNVATDVLQNSQSIDAQYFAAQTLRTKVRTFAAAWTPCLHWFARANTSQSKRDVPQTVRWTKFAQRFLQHAASHREHR